MALPKTIIILALSLLLSQTGLAMHDVHCLDGEHEQACEIYLTHDHGVNKNTDNIQLEVSVYAKKPGSHTSLVPPALSLSLYLSRAPPYLHS